jgi:hypothetical protein
VRNNLIILSLVVVLAGCASGPPPVMAPLIQKVEVPIAVPCKVTIPKAPIFNFNSLSTDQDIFEKTRAILADIRLHFAYEAELLGALNSCVK